MKERPILFSAPMVRALLDGSKTQTRRIVKLPHMNPLGQWEPTTIGGEDGGHTKHGAELPLQGGIWHTRTGECLMSPYGQPGDRLWVRETHFQRKWEGQDVVNGTSVPSQKTTVSYAADNYDPDEIAALGRKVPSIHMPRWVCRLELEIVSVRVERLNNCSETDARAEGVKRSQRAVSSALAVPCFWDYLLDRPEYTNARASYSSLWESINGAGSWDANPWVWAITFRRVLP